MDNKLIPPNVRSIKENCKIIVDGIEINADFFETYGGFFDTVTGLLYKTPLPENKKFIRLMENEGYKC